MSAGFERFIALRYLRSKRKEVFISIITVISILGVAISVMVLDTVLAVMTGFEEELREKLVGTSAHIVVRHSAGPITDWPSVIEVLRKVPEVVSAVPYTYNQAMLSGPAGAVGLLIRGIPDLPEAKDKLQEVLVPGTNISDLFAPVEIEVTRPDGVLDRVELPPLLIGKTLQQKLGVGRASPVTLISPEVTSSPQGLIPRLRRFAVIGSYSSGLIEYETGLAYTSLQDSQAFFRMTGVTGIEVQVVDMLRAQEIAIVVREHLEQVDPLFYATDWTEPNKPLWEAMRLEKRVYFIVLLLLILVASFSIVSTLVMVVMEKNKDIAILKTMGASDSSVLKVFLLQGALIGLIGTILGTILGLLFCLGLRSYGFEIDPKVFSLTEVPVHMVPSNFALVAISAFVITTLAGIYPAVRAARVRPAEALRFD